MTLSSLPTLVLALTLVSLIGSVSGDKHVYIDSITGSDSGSGDSSQPVQTLTTGLKKLATKVALMSGSENVIVHLTGTFSQERLVLQGKHMGKNKNARVIFRGEGSGARLLGGDELDFQPYSSYSSDNPGRLLCDTIPGVDLSKLWIARPPPHFPPPGTDSDSGLRWPDKDCRDTVDYASPPSLSVGGEVMDRAREPSLPERVFPRPEMGSVRDIWIRTNKACKGRCQGKVYFAASDRASIDKASSASWNSGAVSVHMFNRVDWFDGRVRVGARAGSYFKGDTRQKAPGDPDEGKKFHVVKGGKFYLEGAVEYLDKEGEYHVSLGEKDGGASRGYTIFYPPVSVDLSSPSSSAVLSLAGAPVIYLKGEDAHVAFENLHLEGARSTLARVEAAHVSFDQCLFLSSGSTAVETWGHNIRFTDCVFEGSGGSALTLESDLDSSDSKTWPLLDSGLAITDSLVSDYSRSCRHYSEGLRASGFGVMVANNHFRASSAPGVDLVGGGMKMVHNVFSHLSDGSYDTGAVHWVAESPMERGNEVSYNVFFRNGVSDSPCTASTSCFNADIYIDDMAGAMTINGNVFFKDDAQQPRPPSSSFSKVAWRAILVNGGADVTVYENAAVLPEDGTVPGLVSNKAIFFEQTCGGTRWPDSKTCGNTGVCKNSPFYKRMRSYGWNKGLWKEMFPELSRYSANPKQASNYWCAANQNCPMGAWNNTVVCNTGLGPGRSSAHKALWPSDVDSSLKEGKQVPKRDLALEERGNWHNSEWSRSKADADAAEEAGYEAVLALLLHAALEAEAPRNDCSQGPRAGAFRIELVGRGKNACSKRWAVDGFASCDPCIENAGTGGSVHCAGRDLPAGNTCSCGEPREPVPPPVSSPTTPTSPVASTVAPTLAPSSSPDEYESLTGVGYCMSSIEEQVSGPTTATLCWAKCKEEYPTWPGYVEWFEDDCFCQKTCPCLGDIAGNGRVTMVPADFILPAKKDQRLKYKNKVKWNCAWAARTNKCNKKWKKKKIGTYWCPVSCEMC